MASDLSAMDGMEEDGEGRRSWLGSANAYRLISVIVFLALWEAYGRQVDPIFLSYPTAIAVAFYEVALSGELVSQFLLSIQEFVVGYGTAAVVGVVVGVLMGRYAKVEWVIDPYINALYATPNVALIPLIILWLGLGIWAKIAIVFLATFFPVVINTYSGVRNISGSLVETAQAYGANERQLFTKVVIPAALPFIMVGLRLAIGRGIVGMVVAEMFTAITGLGAMIMKYSGAFATDKLFVGIIVLAVMGVCLTELMKVAETRLAPWKESERAQ